MGGPGAGGPERLVGGGKGLQGWARGVEGIRRMGHASDGPQPHASRLIVRPNVWPFLLLAGPQRTCSTVILFVINVFYGHIKNKKKITILRSVALRCERAIVRRPAYGLVCIRGPRPSKSHIPDCVIHRWPSDPRTSARCCCCIFVCPRT